MPLRDLLKKKDKIEHDETPMNSTNLPQASEFTFIRTDTHTEERIAPPVFYNDADSLPKNEKGTLSPKRSLFRKSPKTSPARSRDPSPPSTHERKRLSQRLHLKRDRADSTNLPTDLPAIEGAYSPGLDQEDQEAQWEERATRLAQKSPITPVAPGPPSPGIANLSLNEKGSPRSHSRPRSISDAQTDVDIQEAIRLHETGSLEDATRMFATLAERGNVLSQVLYGLSLRHGWGCKPDPEKAITYLSAAASNSAEIERLALAAGMKKGGAAKGELVLAIFELANCFRYGWGCDIDKVAARQYYETAANLGDTDAMSEAAWCYMEGFGGPKDKFKAAQLLRLAENSGAKTVGNSWIWKEKYNPK